MKKEEVENQEKVLKEKKVWEKSVHSHKVIQKEEKFENKIEKILLSEQPSGLLLCKGTNRKLLKESHEGEFMGHFGVDKTLELLKGKFFWPHMRKDVQRHFRGCISYLKAKSKAMFHGLYTPLPFASASWEDISTNFILGFPRTTIGFDSIFMVVDRFHKMTHFISCHKVDDANNISKLFFREVVRLHGLPQNIVLDRDPKFVGHFLGLFWKKLELS